MIVVADSSSLIILAKLCLFEILPKLFSRVYVSMEVRDEVAVSGAGRPGSVEISQSEWIEAKQIQNPSELFSLHDLHQLGVGELSTILLAKDVGADKVLLDDRRARQLAKPRAWRSAELREYSSYLM